MATPATTLRRCFQRPYDRSLENYPVEPAQSGTKTNNTNPPSSSMTTAKITPPAFAHKIIATHWTGLCNEFINAVPAPGPMDEHLTLREAVTRHASEGDVVGTSALHVLHPLNQAFSSHPITQGTVTCLAEVTATKLRADITYFKNPATAAASAKRSFAVVEFKRRCLIDKAEFEYAEKLKANVPEANITQQQVNQIAQGAMGRNLDNTYYDDYSCKLVKQAAAYAMTHRTKYVALFNWETLVLVRFQAMRLRDGSGNLKTVKHLRADGVGEWCQTTIITASAQMRPALLGFLAEAYVACT